MRIIESGIYPYPVLKEEPLDFKNGAIEFSCVYEDKDDVINFVIESKINEIVFSKYLNDGTISAKFEIECEDTYFCHLTEIAIGQFIVSCPKSVISGRVATRLILHNTKIIGDYFSEDFAPEFGNETFHLRKGSILGFSNRIVFNFPHPRIHFSQIFELVRSDDESVSDLEYFVDISDNDKIKIYAGKTMHELIEQSRHLNWGKLLNLSSVYSTCLMESISEIQKNHKEHQEKRWYKLLDQTIANCSHGEGLHDENLENLRTVQKLLNYPYNESYQYYKMESADE